MNLKKQNQLFVLGLVLTGAFLFLTGGEVLAQKDVNIGQTGDSVKILSDELCFRGVCLPSWTWNLNGTSAYYNSGRIGIGTSTPGAGLHINRTDGFFTLGSVTFGGPLYIDRGPTSILTVDNSGNVYATSTSAITSAVGLPTTATNGQTLRYNNGSWINNSVLYNNGTNVGIGTTTPQAKLDVNGGVLIGANVATLGALGATAQIVSPTNASTLILATSDNGNSTGGLDFQYDSGKAGLRRIARIGAVTQSGGGGDLIFQTAPSATGAYATQMTLLRSGNIGIGTTTPAHKLSLDSHATSYAIDAGNQKIGNVADPTVAKDVVNLGYLNSSLSAFAPGGASSTWALSGNNIYNSNSGNVGIGTTTPTAKLSIDGAGTYSILAGNQRIGNVADPAIAKDVVNLGYLNSSLATKWTKNGDTLGSDTTWLGSSDNFDISFRTNNTERMRILKNGNVGVGTSNPLSKLHINSGTLAASGVTDVLTLQMQYATANEIPRIKISNAANLTYAAIDFPLSPNSSSGAIAFSSNNNGTLGEVMRINGNGNVGIGTTTPGHRLVVSNSASSHSIDAGNQRVGNAADPTTAKDLVTLGFLNSSLSASSTWTLSGNNLYNNNLTGNVGIGTTTPAQKLEIAGAIKIANTTATCNIAQTGTFKYDSVSGQSYLCDGTRWLNQKNCGLMTDNDGKTYGTVQIGGQCWMAENINVGTMLASGATMPTITDQTIEKWCYNNDPALCAAEGGLYHWDEAMRGSQVAGAQGICPTGWHIPTDAEYNILEKTVLGVIASPNAQYACNLSVSSWRRCADDSGTDTGGTYGVGKSLKSVGIGSGVGAGNDLVGFKALLPGFRFTGGSFYDRSSGLTLWSSTPSGSNAWSRSLYTSYSTVYRNALNKAYGFSVRCLRD